MMDGTLYKVYSILQLPMKNLNCATSKLGLIAGWQEGTVDEFFDLFLYLANVNHHYNNINVLYWLFKPGVDQLNFLESLLSR